MRNYDRHPGGQDEGNAMGPLMSAFDRADAILL